MSNIPKVGHLQNSLYAHFNTSSNKRYKSLQGTYNPRLGGSYKGPQKNPKFRSKLELRLMTMLDNSNRVVSWTYESKKIPYVDKSTILINMSGMKSNPTRNYIIDFIVSVKNNFGGITTFWIETKSANDLVVSKKKNTKNAKIAEEIRIKNYSKWIAAQKAAKAVGAHFVVITENELDKLKKLIYG